MEKYDYFAAVRESIRDYISDHDVVVTTSNKDDLYHELYDDMFVSDQVTGNASGSFTFNTWQAEENICLNLDLLKEALEEFGNPDLDVLGSPEGADVTIRCYVLGQVLSDVLDEVAIDDNEEESEE